MRRFAILLCVLAIACLGSAAHRHSHRHHHVRRVAVFRARHFLDSGRPIRYGEFKLGRAHYHTVTANIADPSVVVSTVLSRGVSSVRDLLKGPNACAAITGTFFAPRSGYPVGDVVVDGTLRVVGRRGSALAIDYAGKPHIFDTEFGKPVDWSNYRWALRGSVRLVFNGRPSVNPKWQRFRDSRIWSRVARTGAGITKCGKLVLMATSNPVTLSEFARAMLKVGAVEAVNFDGGSSTCMFYRGVVIIQPARRLSNMLLLTETRSSGGSALNRAPRSTYLNQ